MANVLIESTTLDGLANMIAAKSGEAVPMTLDEMTAAVHGISETSAPTLETVTKTYTPSTASVADTITPSAGYDGIEELDVTVNAVPVASWGDSQGSVIKDGSNYIYARSYPNFSAGYLSEVDPFYYSIPLESKSVTPSETSQIVTPTSDNFYLDSVTVSAIPSNYVGSGVTQRTSADLTASGATVTVPSGYYENNASKAVSSGSATPAASISGTSATVSTDTNTLTLSKTVSNTPQVSAGYVSTGTAGNSNVSLTASVTTKAAATITPGTTNQTIASGTYLTGTQTISGDANLVAGNIKSGTTIFGVTGSYTGGGSGKATYVYDGLASRTANSYGATSATVTVTKAGTYNISYVAIRGSSSGTMGTNLHIGSTSGTNNQTWNNGTYGQYVQQTNKTISANQAVTIYATSGSNSRTIYVGMLIVQEV